ncbi:autotransporter domain-containing protein [Phyllobacterium sp. LjRoot231]|uniref:autotransporter outer membrane beta-barrel domain-containing protein n=1 Tax=Phyllobacterium sp. LjRoot231 TaxID=3342289 RepID=UPI003ECD0851
MTLRKALRASTALTVVSVLGMAATVSLSVFDEANAQTWVGATPDYGTPGNWSSPADVPDTSTESAAFNGAGSATVDLGGVAYEVNSWQFTGASTQYVVQTGSVSFATGLINSTGTATLVSATITGGTVTQAGTDFLYLTAANTYSGGTDVTSGFLRATTTGALGTGAVSVGNAFGGASAELQLTNGFDAQSLNITNESTGATLFVGGSAGSATIINREGGQTVFNSGSTAGNATITNAISPGDPSLTVFNDTSTAGNANFSLPGGDVRFQGNSTAGNATLSGTATILFSQNATGGNATMNMSSDTGTVRFLGNSTAGAAIINNTTGSQVIFADGGTSAGNAIITNSGVGTLNSSTTEFDSTSTAGNASITNLNGGRTNFFNTSTAGSATITNDNGGGTFFDDNSTAGNASLVAIGTGFVDFSRSANTADTAGSIEGSGQLRLGAIDFTVGSNNLSTTFSGVIQDGGANGGTGASLIKTGTGTLTLSGINTYTGGTTVNQGTLSVNGTIGAVDVMNGATLGGIGTVGNTIVASGATIAPGNSIGTLNVAGNITLAAGSIYSVELAGSGASDLIAATGVATLQGGSVAVTTLDPQTSYQNGQTYRILTAQGGVSGTFDPNVLSNSAFLSATLANTANAVDLTIAVQQTPPNPPNPPGPPQVFVTAAQTRNQFATAGALDTLVQSGSSLALYNSLLVLDAATARDAFDSLSGEIYASTKTALIEDSHFIRDAAINRVRSSFGGVATAAVPIMAYGEGGPELAPATTEKFGIWGTGFGNWGSTDSDGSAASLDRSTGGFVVGADALVGGNWRVGMLTGYSHTSFDVDDRSSSGDSDNYHLGVYGGSQWGNLGFRAGAAYTWNNIETDRSVVFPGFTNDLNADYDAGTAQVFGELGYRIDTSRVAFEPFANLAYVNFRSDSFSESGGAAALSASSETTNTTFSTLGFRASTDFVVSGMSATARGMLGWRHAFDDTTPQSRLAFTGSDAFTIWGVPIDQDALALEAGLELNITHSATLGLSYTGQFGSKAQDNGFKADISFKF